MELLNVQVILRAVRRHRDAGPWLERWATTVRHVSWQNLKQVQEQYPSADGVPLKRIVVTVFNVKGNEYRLLTIVRYQAQQVYIVDVLTHAEYDKNQWKNQI